MTETTRVNCVPINSLSYKCLTNLDKQAASPSPTASSALDNGSSLPIDVKQEIMDHIVQERVQVSGKFVSQILMNGGVYSLDLWSLSFNNSFKEPEIIEILTTLSQNCSNLRELTLGGHTWIYKNRVVKGPMRGLLESSNLSKLRCLKLQQTSSPEELIAVFKSCPNLVKLEICQPSLTCRQINAVVEELSKTSYHKARLSLRELRLPSTCKKSGIIKMLSLFPNVQYLNCCHFEAVLDAIENGLDDCDHGEIDAVRKAALVLAGLRGLTVTHPMGEDAVRCLVSKSGNLEELSLEVHECMILSPICRLKGLKKLALHNSQSSPASFLQQVLPVLEEIGENIEALSLEQFDVVDLSTCARFCPNLKLFSGQWFTILSCTQSTPGLTMSKRERENTKKPFRQLKYLRLRPRSQRSVPANAVEYILNNAHDIEHIELYSCYDLTDEAMKNMMKMNQMAKLRSLILRHGHSISKPCLNHVSSQLGDLRFLDCGRPILSKADLVPNDDDEEDEEPMAV